MRLRRYKVGAVDMHRSKCLILQGIKWWPETASSALTRAEVRNGDGGQGRDRTADAGLFRAARSNAVNSFGLLNDAEGQ